jgi:hypothetical protein
MERHVQSGVHTLVQEEKRRQHDSASSLVREYALTMITFRRPHLNATAGGVFCNGDQGLFQRSVDKKITIITKNDRVQPGVVSLISLTMACLTSSREFRGPRFEVNRDDGAMASPRGDKPPDVRLEASVYVRFLRLRDGTVVGTSARRRRREIECVFARLGCGLARVTTQRCSEGTAASRLGLDGVCSPE